MEILRFIMLTVATIVLCTTCTYGYNRNVQFESSNLYGSRQQYQGNYYGTQATQRYVPEQRTEDKNKGVKKVVNTLNVCVLVVALLVWLSTKPEMVDIPYTFALIFGPLFLVGCLLINVVVWLMGYKGVGLFF